MTGNSPDSVALFFQDPANIKRLSIGQINRLDGALLEIKELQAKELNDVDLANRDVQVRNLRGQMAAIIDEALSNSVTTENPTISENTEPSSPRHMTGKEGHHFG